MNVWSGIVIFGWCIIVCIRCCIVDGFRAGVVMRLRCFLLLGLGFVPQVLMTVVLESLHRGEVVPEAALVLAEVASWILLSAEPF